MYVIYARIKYKKSRKLYWFFDIFTLIFLHEGYFEKSL